jgi:hypothetical protein
MLRHLVAVLLSGFAMAAHAGPVPPCDAVPTPSYGETGGPPQWAIWSADQLHAERWRPAACLGWSGDSRLVAVLASRFRSNDNVFERLGNVDAWPGIRYWSVSRQRWQPLASSVSHLDASGRKSVLPTAFTLAVGQDYLFAERDENSGETTYRMRVVEHSSQRLVLSTENVTSIKVAIITAFEPGSLQTVAFVQKTRIDEWETYQITRVGADASSLVLRYPGSFLNRLEAVRRYLAGLPTDQLAPIAPH